MDAEREVMDMLKQHGTPVRHNKHMAFRVNGHLITITGTKTDRRGWLNKRSEIRRALSAPPSVQMRCNGR